MKIQMSIKEVLNECNDPILFCEYYGFDIVELAKADGFDLVIVLDEADALNWGLIYFKG
jgi:hypothetical protein